MSITKRNDRFDETKQLMEINRWINDGDKQKKHLSNTII